MPSERSRGLAGQQPQPVRLVQHRHYAAHRQWADQRTLGSARRKALRQRRPQRSLGAALQPARYVVLQELPHHRALNLQFRAESFNFTNHTNLGQPNGCVDCPGVAGRIFNAIGNYVPRQWQMALRYTF